ncbi:neuropilin-2-like isoform X1 [Acipenser oxyrinchus oxyrinchus]|uniref:Neuropilin n=1 Tax=Acipenser oxyrinchus oxyrinchus TaxID=40147 RepID=A0AAD8G5B2_ACIOX|nr:neuropilin-2-like isoform X1 [Acipenser oxyrinchus oxyrinchus]
MDIIIPLIGILLLCFLTPAVSGQEETSCGGRLNAKDAGYITSPGYPHEYPPHQRCEWVITAPEPTQKIVLNFNPHFELEKLDCRYDYIEIRDGENESGDLLGKHCSNIAPPAIISSGPVLYIKFASDYAHQGAGFSLRYEIYKTGSDYCSRNFTSLSGVIESPEYPDKYPHNLDCIFIITVPPRMEVTLTFLTFDLENDPLLSGEGDCKYDWLEVWDGLPQVGPLIGRYCGTKVPPEIQSSTGIVSLSFHTDMAVAKDGFSAQYIMTPKEATETFHCSSAFGMESGKITDEQISASSSFYDGRWSPRQGRLNNHDNGWTPAEDSNKEYIQVDLLFLKVLTGIATQGAISKETNKSYHITTFKLEVSTNGEDWMMYRHGKNHKVFHGNTDPAEVVLNRIPQPVLTRYVRIRPQAWQNGIALRFELYGCQNTDAPCTEMQGMLSGLIPDSQITASSARDIHWSSGAARLVASRSGWFPRHPQPIAGEEWLQADLGVPKTVTGVIIQGARGGSVSEGSTTVENRAFVRKFRVAHSMNSKDWDFIMDQRTMQPKMFEGNTHYDTPEIRRFSPVPAQYVRVYPERWSPAGIGMRLEVLGCDLLETTSSAETLTPTMRNEDITTEPPCHSDPSGCVTQAPEYIDSTYSFSCEFGSIETNDLCSWSHDPSSDFNWAFLPRGTGGTLGAGPSQDHLLGSNGNGNYLYVEASQKTEGLRAKLLSPPVSALGGQLCMVFWYHMRGANVGTLRVLMSETDQQETTLWSMRGDQGSEWREGRTVLPESPKEYQIVMEADIDHGFKGDIAIDNIHISTSIPVNECTQPFTAFYPETIDDWVVKDIGDSLTLNGKDRANADWITPGPSAGVPVTQISEKDKNWLYSLDPILVTIIAMSSLGVLLGAVCAGLLLYCTCSYNGLSSRSSTTLENYNFELYDGIKHKVKINQQRCCSEA